MPPLTRISIPIFESYFIKDYDERQHLTIRSFEDFSRVQGLVNYMNNENVLGIQKEEIEIVPEFDQKLRELGYAN